MRQILFLLLMVIPIAACEKSDVRINAANIVYNNCIATGENPQWCRCLREDLKTGFSEDAALFVVKGYQHIYVNLEIQSARIRCGCRIQPHLFAKYGLDCSPVKPLKY